MNCTLLLTNAKLSFIGGVQCHVSHTQFQTMLIRRSERQANWRRQQFLHIDDGMMYAIFLFQKCIITAFFGCDATCAFDGHNRNETKRSGR